MTNHDNICLQFFAHKKGRCVPPRMAVISRRASGLGPQSGLAASTVLAGNILVAAGYPHPSGVNVG